MNDFLAWPKAELHVHLDGSLRPETVWELSRDGHIGLPFDTFNELERHLRVPRKCTLPQYLKAFQHTLAVMQEREFLTRVACELVEDAAQDGVRYIEVRFAPSLHRNNGLKLDQIVEAALDGLKRGSRKTGARATLICCAMRQEAPLLSNDVARVAAEYRAAGVVALDLAGPEQGFPAEPHRSAFEYALAHDLHLTIHAGEPCCPENVTRAVALGAQRIGHGTYTRFDDAAGQLLVERNIPLEICPTSNVQIAEFIERYADHPIHRYLAEGITVTLSTDNRLMSNTTLSQEYQHLEPTISPTQLRRISRNGFEAAFLPEVEKQALIAQYFDQSDV